MAQPLLKVYSSDGLTLVESIALTANTGSSSSAYAFRLTNSDADGSVDDAAQPSISVRQIDPDTGEAVLRGFRAVDERWLSIRALGTGSPGDDHLATGWKPCGRGRRLFTPLLPSGGWHDMEIMYSPPLASGEGQIDIVIDAEDSLRNVALDGGHTESSRDGILNGIGDGTHSEILEFAGMTATGTPDEFVQFATLKWDHLGIPYVVLAGPVELTDQDSAAATLGASEAYWARFSAGAGAVTITKSVKFPSGAPDVDDIPDPPDGEPDLGWALRDDTAAIATGDITNNATIGGWAPSNPSGLILAIGPGRGRFDNTYVQRQSQDTITLPASEATNFVWWSNGALARSLTLAARPDPNAYLLLQVPTGVSSITMASLIDYRDPIGAERQAHSFFFSGTVSAGVKAYGVHRSARTGYIRSIRGMILAANSLGSGNSTSDELRVDFKINGVSVFTSGIGAGSFAPGFGGPGLAFPTVDQIDSAAVPEVLEVPPFAVFEAEMTIPNAFGGTAPSNLTLDVTVEVP